MIDRPHRSHTLGGAHTEGVGSIRSDLVQGIFGLGDGAADSCQDVSWQVSQDGEGFGFDLVADAEGLAEKDRGIGAFAAFGFGADLGNKHAYDIYLYNRLKSRTTAITIDDTCLHYDKSQTPLTSLWHKTLAGEIRENRLEVPL